MEVHRKTRLVVLVSAAEQPSVALGSALASIYAKRLPESRATMARARDTNDVVRLVASKQLGVALLRALAVLGDYLLVCRDDLPAAAAYMLTEALAERWRDVDPALVRAAHSPRPPNTLAIPLHPGRARVLPRSLVVLFRSHRGLSSRPPRPVQAQPSKTQILKWSERGL